MSMGRQMEDDKETDQVAVLLDETRRTDANVNLRPVVKSLRRTSVNDCLIADNREKSRKSNRPPSAQNFKGRTSRSTRRRT